MNYPDIQKLFDEQNLLCFGGPNSECSGCKFGNCYGCSDLRLLEAYEAAIKLEIEADKIEIRNKIEVLESHLESKKKQINFVLRCKDKIEIDRDRQKLDNIELAQCNVELGKENERLKGALKFVMKQLKTSELAGYSASRITLIKVAEVLEGEKSCQTIV